MPRINIRKHDQFVVRVDRLAADWASFKQRRDAAKEAYCAAFCERVQALFNDVRSGVQWQNTAWNFFEVSGRQRQEDAYTRTIAWLMDPAGAHGLRDTFLRAFLEKAGKLVPAGTLECRVTVKRRIPGSGEVDIEV